MSTSRTELMANAKHWLQQAKNGGLKRYGIEAIFVFFDKTGECSGVATATCDKERLVKELKNILAKLEDRVIYSPYGDN